MEVCLTVPIGVSIVAVEIEYPDIVGDFVDEEMGEEDFWIGKPDEEMEGGGEWLTHDEAIEFCGFGAGAIPGASAMIDGNGPWAQGMLSRKDFSGLAITPADRAELERRSQIWWDAYRRGILKRVF